MRRVKTTKVEALNEFKATEYYQKMKQLNDKIAIREAWNFYTDFLCKLRFISLRQYENWSNPF